MRLLLPHPDPDPSLDALYAPPTGPVLRLGLVASVDGSAALEGRSGGLSGPADKQVFRLLRSLADVVLVGAGTARTEGYRPVRLDDGQQAARLARGQRALPPVAVLSGGPGLPAGSPLLAAGAGTLLLTTGAGARAAPAGVEAVALGEDTVDLPAALAALRGRGLSHVLCEGGPALAGTLVAAGLVDELCLTTAPLLAGGDGPRLLVVAAEQHRPVRLAHLLHDQDVLLARWTLGPPQDPPG